MTNPQETYDPLYCKWREDIEWQIATQLHEDGNLDVAEQHYQAAKVWKLRRLELETSTRSGDGHGKEASN